MNWFWLRQNVEAERIRVSRSGIFTKWFIELNLWRKSICLWCGQESQSIVQIWDFIWMFRMERVSWIDDSKMNINWFATINFAAQWRFALTRCIIKIWILFVAQPRPYSCQKLLKILKNSSRLRNMHKFTQAWRKSNTPWWRYATPHSPVGQTARLSGLWQLPVSVGVLFAHFNEKLAIYWLSIQSKFKAAAFKLCIKQYYNIDYSLASLKSGETCLLSVTEN